MGENESGIVRYKIDAGRSRFIVRAFATGLLSAFAHNPTFAIRDFTGVAEFVPDTLENASLELRIKSGSLELTDNVSDKDRREIERQMREEVLEVDRYPEIVYKSSGVTTEKIMAGQYRAIINGGLTMHGVTRDCRITAQLIVSPDTLRANGEFPMRMGDFHIKQVTAVGGTIKLKDEMKSSFDIVAHKQ
jgi:polyisoprenoid-binding protein YceI